MAQSLSKQEQQVTAVRITNMSEYMNNFELNSRIQKLEDQQKVLFKLIEDLSKDTEESL